MSSNYFSGFTYGSPGLNTFDPKGLNQAIAAGYDKIIVTDLSVVNMPANEAAVVAARNSGRDIEIRQGLVLRAIPNLNNGTQKSFLTTVFSITPDAVRLLTHWSLKYPQGPLNPRVSLPFCSNEVVPQCLQVPLEVIKANRDAFLVFNCTLEGDTAVPYSTELLELSPDGFFVRMDGVRSVLPEELRNLKQICKTAKYFLPHYHMGSFMPGQKDVKCLRAVLDGRLFPPPDSMEQISMSEVQELTPPEDFFAKTPRIEVTGSLLSGIKVSPEYQAVEKVPENLRPTDERRRVLISEIKAICMEKLQASYSEDDLEYGVAMLQDELKYIYDAGYMLGESLLMLYKALRSLDKELCILGKYNINTPLVAFLIGLTSYNPIVHEAEGSAKADIIGASDIIQLEMSADSYYLLRETLEQLYGGRVAEVLEEQKFEEVLEKSERARLIMNSFDLSYEEQEVLSKTTVSYRESTNNRHTIIVFPEGINIPIPGIHMEVTEMPFVTPSFTYLASVLVFGISVCTSNTLAVFEKVKEKLLLPRISKAAEKKVFEQFLWGISREISVGIAELTSPLLRKKIREIKPRNRYMLSTVIADYYSFDAAYKDCIYYHQLTDIIFELFVAQLCKPQEYFDAIAPEPHNDFLWIDEEVLERLVFDEPLFDGRNEDMEALLYENGIPTDFVTVPANRQCLLLAYVRRKRTYPVLFLD